MRAVWKVGDESLQRSSRRVVLLNNDNSNLLPLFIYILIWGFNQRFIP